MSVLERFDWFAESLPRICLYCKHGYPVVWGGEHFLETVGCAAHTAWGLKSKKLTAPSIDRRYECGRGYMPLMMADETCPSFRPVRPCGDAPERRKFRLLDAYGYFDEARPDEEG